MRAPSLGLVWELERPYEMAELPELRGDWVYIGGGQRNSVWRRSPWSPKCLIGGRTMAHRVARMTADDGAVWLMGLAGR